ncbi:homoserine O-succinyltransferase, partial [Clostridium sp. ZBS12]|uniref:homoserine O-acetyltransferase/O-succinyltransferase family protein n=1 Tax=Clostridium sp. ZBS12 TaxID=2949972 RepID=UPI00207AAD19
MSPARVVGLNASRATTQAVIPLSTALLTVIPDTILAENRLFRLLSTTPLHCEVYIIQTKSYF